ncbi:MAG: hypothetical protein MK102_08490 [Fuerstiella sp.]|nr:hypothetical protein [Fuerstiella sp.]
MRTSCETDWLDSVMTPQIVANLIGHSVTRHINDHHFEQFNAEVEKMPRRRENEPLWPK